MAYEERGKAGTQKEPYRRPVAESGHFVSRGPVIRPRYVYKVRLAHGSDLEFIVQDDMAMYCHYQAWLNGQEALTTIHARNGLYFRDGGTDVLVDFKHIVMMQVHEAKE